MIVPLIKMLVSTTAEGFFIHFLSDFFDCFGNVFVDFVRVFIGVFGLDSFDSVPQVLFLLKLCEFIEHFQADDCGLGLIVGYDHDGFLGPFYAGEDAFVATLDVAARNGLRES